VGEQLLETMALHLPGRRRSLRQKATDILTHVGIPSAERRAKDFPHQFSGGMCQRAMIGMGIACAPSLLIADEPTTALDVTIQVQILALIRRLAAELGMAVLLVCHDLGMISQMCHRVIVMYAGKIVELRERLGLAYLFISHDRGVVRFISHRVAVMYLGRLVEIAPAASLFGTPLHPYSRALLAAIPVIGDGGSSMFEQTERLPSGELSNPIDLPPECRFYNRCPYRMERRRAVEPELKSVESVHAVACHLYE